MPTRTISLIPKVFLSLPSELLFTPVDLHSLGRHKGGLSTNCLVLTLVSVTDNENSSVAWTPCPFFPVMIALKPFTVHAIISSWTGNGVIKIHWMHFGVGRGGEQRGRQGGGIKANLHSSRFHMEPSASGRCGGSSVIPSCCFGRLHKKYPWQFWIACINLFMAVGLLVALSSLFSPFWVSHISSSLLYPT